MFYEVEKMSHQVSYDDLDSMLTFAMDYLEFDTDVPLIISFEVDNEQQSGFIDVDEDEILMNINPKLTGEELVRTVFHELVHAKQIQSGQYDPNDSTWGGVMYTCDYWNLPWEKDAYQKEEEMFIEYSKN
jgi:hypothetical protein